VAAATAVKPTRWGLAAKLFAVLILLGAVAICGVAIFAVTQFVTNKGNELNGK
jgi:hypothetical protein